MKFYIKEKILSFGDNFTITDVGGNPAFMVKGQIFSFGNKLSLYWRFRKHPLHLGISYSSGPSDT
ncbi:hypothetical protein ACPWSR_04770 [Alloiococcus sp. CFN-8]|uniref:hypothetical protein n=1 Tax=Alloiococcus sp. CFN-8 TaxID=3416081 RepID=UPI003CEDD31F